MKPNWRAGALAVLALACVAGLGSAAALATGGSGTLLSWGDGSVGELGTGTTGGSGVPIAVSAGAIPSGTSFTQVAEGGYTFIGTNDFSLALSSSGALYAWGYDGQGELGDASTSESNVPAKVAAGAIPAGTTIKQIAAGEENALAIGSNGKAYAWGSEVAGQLGNGSNSSYTDVPVAVSAGAIPAGATLTQVAAGSFSGFALSSAGNVYAWGAGSEGDLGDGSSSESDVPVAVAAGAIPAGTRMVQVAADNANGYALSSTGHVYAWGVGDSDELGDNSGAGSDVPVAVAAGAIPPGVAITQIATGNQFVIALSSSGKVYAWGNGSGGDLGDGSTANAPAPVAVSAGAIPAGTRIIQVAASAGNGYAVSSTGAVYAWGGNSVGELGNGAVASATSDVPVAVSLPAGTTIDALAASGGGATHELAIVGDLGVSTGSLPAGTVGLPYSAAVSATGGAGGDVWSASGLPAGLSINASSGAITGTPTAAGNATVTLSVSDADGLTVSASLAIDVTSFAAASATVNPRTGAIAFAQPLTGAGTLSWTLTFPNGSDGVFAAKRHKAHKPKCSATQVRLKGRCRPAAVAFGSGSTSVTAAGTATFNVTPGASALKALKTALRHHRGVAVSATLTFQSAPGGSPVSETQTVLDKLAKPKHKKHKK